MVFRLDYATSFPETNGITMYFASYSKILLTSKAKLREANASIAKDTLQTVFNKLEVRLSPAISQDRGHL